MQTKKAFSFIEIIIVVSILTLLAVVGMSYQWASNQKAINTRIIWDIWTLNNSLVNYLEEKNSLPDPKWNTNFFSSGAEYSHDETSAFWVHWFVTQNLLPKKYLNYLPLDQRTNQYYAYWKTIDNKYYEIAWVLNVEWEYTTKLQWNYPAENGPYSLIREYNWPQFISDNSKESFPYNPDERVLVWKINNITGTVKINWNSTNILTHTLVEWDTIETSASSSATIFFSDWSQSLLEENSKLKLENLEFQEKDNLLTRIQLLLESGTLWTKATNLNSEEWNSEFQVQSWDYTAAVRWTIFWVTSNWTTTKVEVAKWKVKLYKTPPIKTTPVEEVQTTIKEIDEWKKIEIENTLTTPTTTTTVIVPAIQVHLIKPNVRIKPIKNVKTLLEKVNEIKEDKDKETWFIKFNGELIKVDQDLAKEWYELYAYAPYDDDNELYNKEWEIYDKDNWSSSTNIETFWYKWREISGSNYLKYEDLDLEEDFAIEMSVLGSDLKRTSWTYYLFDDADNNTNQIYLDVYSWSLYLWYTNDNDFNNVIWYDLSSLDNNKFYKVIAKINKENWDLIIKDENWNRINFTNKSTSTSEPTEIELKNIMIWSNESKNNQWDWIIDYVKIYKVDN